MVRPLFVAYGNDDDGDGDGDGWRQLWLFYDKN